MAIEKKLVHFKTFAKFKEALDAGNILNTSIVWISETRQMYTHGVYYNCENGIVTVSHPTNILEIKAITQEVYDEIVDAAKNGRTVLMYDETGSNTLISSNISIIDSSVYVSGRMLFVPSREQMTSVDMMFEFKQNLTVVANATVIDKRISIVNNKYRYYFSVHEGNTEIHPDNIPLSTETSVGGIKSATMTEDEYNALATKQADCLYILTSN